MADIFDFPEHPDSQISSLALEGKAPVQPCEQMDYYEIDEENGTISFDKSSKYYQFEKAGLACHGYDLDTITDLSTYLELTRRYRHTIHQFFVDEVMSRDNSMGNRAIKAIVTGDSERGCELLRKSERIHELGLKIVD